MSVAYVWARKQAQVGSDQKRALHSSQCDENGIGANDETADTVLVRFGDKGIFGITSEWVGEKI